jgi:hypothetical protein
VQAAAPLKTGHANLGQDNVLLVDWNNDVFLLKKVKFGCPFPDTVITFLGAAKRNMD